MHTSSLPHHHLGDKFAMRLLSHSLAVSYNYYELHKNKSIQVNGDTAKQIKIFVAAGRNIIHRVQKKGDIFVFPIYLSVFGQIL